jgi:hypothetical protein
MLVADETYSWGAGCVWRNDECIVNLMYIHCSSLHHDVWVGTEDLNQDLYQAPACRKLMAEEGGSNSFGGRGPNLRLFLSQHIKSMLGDLMCWEKTSPLQIGFSQLIQTAACHILECCVLSGLVFVHNGPPIQGVCVGDELFDGDWLWCVHQKQRARSTQTISVSAGVHVCRIGCHKSMDSAECRC